jgi:hypothetical protein
MDNHLYGKPAFNPNVVDIVYPIQDFLVTEDNTFITDENGDDILVV